MSAYRGQGRDGAQWGWGWGVWGGGGGGRSRDTSRTATPIVWSQEPRLRGRPVEGFDASIRLTTRQPYARSDARCHPNAHLVVATRATTWWLLAGDATYAEKRDSEWPYRRGRRERQAGTATRTRRLLSLCASRRVVVVPAHTRTARGGSPVRSSTEVKRSGPGIRRGNPAAEVDDLAAGTECSSGLPSAPTTAGSGSAAPAVASPADAHQPILEITAS